MRVLLIAANTERINMVALPVGLGLVAAATRTAGHETTFLDLLEHADPERALVDAIGSSRPEVIGVSIRNIDDQCSGAPRLLLDQARALVERCRELSDAPIVVGGPGYSIFPAEVLAYVGADFGVWGDGERAFPALLGCFTSGGDPCDVAGVLRAGGPMPLHRATAESLDDLPLWEELCDWGGNREDPNLWIPVQSRRGCPNACSYCSTERVQGKKLRARSPEAVVAHVGRLAAAGFRRVYFVDNSFNIPESHAFALCEGLAVLDPGVDWRCILYPENVSEGLVEAMATAGCKEVALGFESGNAGVLREMNKRYTPAQVRETSELLRKRGIRRMGFLLLGGPGETRESVEESLAFAASLKLDAMRVTVGIRIYPGTPLARRAVAEGLISEGEDLLQPKFYIAPGLEKWLRERVEGMI